MSAISELVDMARSFKRYGKYRRLRIERLQKLWIAQIKVKDRHRQGVMRGMVLTRETTASKGRLISLILIYHHLHEPQPKCLQNPTASKTSEKMLRKHDKSSTSSTRFLHFWYVSPPLGLYQSDHSCSRMRTSTDRRYLSAYP